MAWSALRRLWPAARRTLRAAKKGGGRDGVAAKGAVRSATLPDPIHQLEALRKEILKELIFSKASAELSNARTVRLLKMYAGSYAGVPKTKKLLSDFGVEYGKLAKEIEDTTAVSTRTFKLALRKTIVLELSGSGQQQPPFGIQGWGVAGKMIVAGAEHLFEEFLLQQKMAVFATKMLSNLIKDNTSISLMMMSLILLFKYGIDVKETWAHDCFIASINRLKAIAEGVAEEPEEGHQPVWEEEGLQPVWL